jgi:hypothetical protein
VELSNVRRVTDAIGLSGQYDMATPLARARAKIEEIERELRKYPDFQLYLLAGSENDRRRMEAILIGIPGFGLWHKLRRCVALEPEGVVALAE